MLGYNSKIHSEGSDEQVFESGSILTMTQGAQIKIKLAFATGTALAAYTAACFATPFPCKVVSLTEMHTTAGTDAGAVTLDLQKNTDTAGTAATVLSSTLSLKATAKTLRSATVAANTLAAGDKLLLVCTGVQTAVSGVTVEIVVQLL